MAQEARKVLIDVDKELLRRIDHIAVDWDMFRKKAIVRLLELAVQRTENQLQLPEGMPVSK